MITAQTRTHTKKTRCWAAAYGRGELWSPPGPYFLPPLLIPHHLPLRSRFASPKLMLLLLHIWLWVVSSFISMHFLLLTINWFKFPMCWNFRFVSSSILHVWTDIGFLLNPPLSFPQARLWTCHWHKRVKASQNVSFSNGMSKRWVHS